MATISQQPHTDVARAAPKARWAGALLGCDGRRWLGTGGEVAGANGATRQTLKFAFVVSAALAACVCTMNVISELHRPDRDIFGPIVWEASSWLSLMASFWIVWLSYRIARPFARQPLKLSVHIVGAMLFAVAHVLGFIVLREIAYALAGSDYVFGSFWPNFAYELRKDVIGYALFFGIIASVERLHRRQQLVTALEHVPTIDVRDGSRLHRVRLAELLAINSAGNYVELHLVGGRKLMMRSPLGNLEAKLGPLGFVRTHRSWVVNAAKVTGLSPQGSGDYSVEINTLTVPLSRRFPHTLARLKETPAI